MPSHVWRHGRRRRIARLPFVLPAAGRTEGMRSPSEVVAMFQVRKTVEQGVISSHGEATRFFVTFLDNHDQHTRFHYVDAQDPHRFDDQTTMALACLFALPGIPCIYYRTEQGLSGAGQSEQSVREALWGNPQSFDLQHPFYPPFGASRGSQSKAGAALRSLLFPPDIKKWRAIRRLSVSRWGACFLAHSKR
jgi:glycosidase